MLLLSFPQQVLVFILLAVQLVTIPGTSAARQDKNLTATILPEPKEDNTSRLNVQRLQKTVQKQFRLLVLTELKMLVSFEGGSVILMMTYMSMCQC